MPPRADSAALDDRAAPAPSWTAPYDALLRALGDAFALLQCATPLNAAAEFRALLVRWRAGDAVAPRWHAPGVDRHALARARATVERARAAFLGASPWERVYAARFEELSRELALVDATFGPEVARLAHARWGAAHAEADRLAAAWLDEPPSTPDDEDEIATDDDHDPRSLVSSLRRAIGAARVPVRVVVRDRVGALAASGDGVVIVARGRTATPREIERVVLHELEGHVLPRERARGRAPAILSLGSAGASEDEEGRALVLEERAGFLHARRRRALAARHLAARRVLDGAGFVDLVRWLHDELGEPLDEALRVASRAMRGGFAHRGEVRGGVAREVIYLPGYLRVRTAVQRDPGALARLGTARLSLAARAALDVSDGV